MGIDELMFHVWSHYGGNISQLWGAFFFCQQSRLSGFLRVKWVPCILQRIDKRRGHMGISYTLWYFKIAIEHGPFSSLIGL